MIATIKNYFFEKKKRQVRQDIRQHQHRKVSQRPYIGVIAELMMQSQLDQLIEFYKEQHWLQIPCNILLYEDDQKFDLPFQFHYYTRNEVNWFDVPAFEKTKAFLGADYEKMIVLNPLNRKHIHFLASVSKANITCGLASLEEFQTVYQLMVDLDDVRDYKKAIQEIYEHYGKMI